MQRHDFPQGSPEWHAHRANCFNASDAPAMLGCGLKTRSELLREVHTSLAREVSTYVQERIFDPGHRFEELARPLAEEIIGEDLGRVVGSLDVGLSRPLGASFDGITFMDDTLFEHKRLNVELLKVFDQIEFGAAPSSVLPKMYRVQMEQQLLVSSGERVLFMASEWQGETLIEERHCWYVSDPALRAEILAGWQQFDADLAAYQPTPAAAPAPVAKPVAALPVVFDMRVEGRLVSCNLEAYKPAALAYISEINTTLTTDQDFADAEADAKFCRDSASKLKLAIEQALGQMGDINAAIGTVREIAAAFDAKGLALEKLVKSEKDSRREAIVVGATQALRKHIEGLNQRLGRAYMPAIPADFAGAIKGKRNLDSMQDAVDTELARAKIAANDTADRIDLNLKHLRENADGYQALFPDTASIVLKAPEDLQRLVKARIDEHKAAEEKRLEAERERIRAEEAARLEREAKAEADRIERERASTAQVEAERIRAEAQANAQREAAQKLAAEQAAARAISQAAAPAPAPAPVVASAPAATDTGERINLGQINERIAPLSITAAGLATLGFEHVATERASKLYRASDFGAMVAAMRQHLQDLSIPA